ncbi:MAG: RNA polymerase sigma factor RpoD/SigA [Treponema sp.]|nr:RNA polymerase sigma factor RpoD/SigA [Treponema sp.]
MEMYEIYTKQIQRYSLLTYEQEVVLSKRIEQGDVTARQELVQGNLRLVVSIANHFAMSRSMLMDLIQEGNMALMVAAEKYHYSFNTRFSTYAYAWITQYMLRYLNTRVSMITLPHRKDEMLRRITAARQTLVQKTGSEPTVAELAAYLNVTECEVKNLLSYDYTFTSLDIECSEENGATIGELMPDVTYEPEREYFTQESKRTVGALVEALPEKERAVIRYRYNFNNDVHTKTLRELSHDLGVSAETVRQMEMRAVRRMRNIVSSSPVEEVFVAC